MHWSAFPCQNFLKISRRAKRKWNGSDQVEICPVKVVHLQRWSSLTGRFSRILRFRFQKFSFPVPLQLVTTVKMADGSDVSVYECSVCKLQTQELNLLLMHSCTQGSGTAVHLNLFFLLVFLSVFKDKYFTGFSAF